MPSILPRMRMFIVAERSAVSKPSLVLKPDLGRSRLARSGIETIVPGSNVLLLLNETLVLEWRQKPLENVLFD